MNPTPSLFFRALGATSLAGEGFHRADHRQVIVDGTDPYPAYCLFPACEPVTFERLRDGIRIMSVAG